MPWRARLLPGSDPVHKVTIIPRGRALGLTMQLPEEDRHGYSRNYLRNNLVVLLGGRVAEEIVFDDITTGASNDIERVTRMARKMVCEWGMSDAIGTLSIGETGEEVFIGREWVQNKNYSERDRPSGGRRGQAHRGRGPCPLRQAAGRQPCGPGPHRAGPAGTRDHQRRGTGCAHGEQAPAAAGCQRQAGEGRPCRGLRAGAGSVRCGRRGARGGHGCRGRSRKAEQGDAATDGKTQDNDENEQRKQ